MSETTTQIALDIEQKLKNDVTKFLETYKVKKEANDLAGALTNILLAGNNLYSLRSTGKLDDQFKVEFEGEELSGDVLVRKVFEYISSYQEQLKTKIMSQGQSGPGEEEGDTCAKVSKFELSPCKKSNCLLYKDVVGLENEKRMIQDSFANPIMYPSLYPKTTKGVLFYGPPGVGKTFIMKATLNELQLVDPKLRVLFYAPTGAEMKGKFVGETEKNIKAYFTCASRDAEECERRQAEEGSDIKFISIIFIDEIEAIAGDRSKSGEFMTNSVNTLLQMMDGVNSFRNVSVVGATNYPWNLDSAILRRFPKRIHIALPKTDTVKKLIDFNLDLFVNCENHIDDAIMEYDCFFKSKVNEKPKRDTKADEKKRTDKECNLKSCPMDPEEKDSRFRAKYLMNDKLRHFMGVEGNMGTSDINKQIAMSVFRCEGKDPISAKVVGPPFSNSDITALTNSICTSSARRAKDSEFFFTKVNDEMMYIPTSCDLTGEYQKYRDPISLILDNPHYENHYIKELTKIQKDNEAFKTNEEGILDNTQDNTREYQYLEDWIKRRKINNKPFFYCSKKLNIETKKNLNELEDKVDGVDSYTILVDEISKTVLGSTINISSNDLYPLVPIPKTMKYKHLVLNCPTKNTFDLKSFRDGKVTTGETQSGGYINLDKQIKKMDALIETKTEEGNNEEAFNLYLKRNSLIKQSKLMSGGANSNDSDSAIGSQDNYFGSNNESRPASYGPASYGPASPVPEANPASPGPDSLTPAPEPLPEPEVESDCGQGTYDPDLCDSKPECFYTQDGECLSREIYEKDQRFKEANDEKKAADRESVEAKKADIITIGLIKEREREELNSSFKEESEPKDRIKKNEKHLQLREMEYFNRMSHTEFLIDQYALFDVNYSTIQDLGNKPVFLVRTKEQDPEKEDPEKEDPEKEDTEDHFYSIHLDQIKYEDTDNKNTDLVKTLLSDIKVIMKVTQNKKFKSKKSVLQSKFISVMESFKPYTKILPELMKDFLKVNSKQEINNIQEFADTVLFEMEDGVSSFKKFLNNSIYRNLSEKINLKEFSRDKINDAKSEKIDRLLQTNQGVSVSREMEKLLKDNKKLFMYFKSNLKKIMKKITNNIYLVVDEPSKMRIVYEFSTGADSKIDQKTNLYLSKEKCYGVISLPSILGVIFKQSFFDMTLNYQAAYSYKLLNKLGKDAIETVPPFLYMLYSYGRDAFFNFADARRRTPFTVNMEGAEIVGGHKGGDNNPVLGISGSTRHLWLGNPSSRTRVDNFEDALNNQQPKEESNLEQGIKVGDRVELIENNIEFGYGSTGVKKGDIATVSEKGTYNGKSTLSLEFENKTFPPNQPFKVFTSEVKKVSNTGGYSDFDKLRKKKKKSKKKRRFIKTKSNTNPKSKILIKKKSQKKNKYYKQSGGEPFTLAAIAVAGLATASYGYGAYKLEEEKHKFDQQNWYTLSNTIDNYESSLEQLISKTDVIYYSNKDADGIYESFIPLLNNPDQPFPYDWKNNELQPSYSENENIDKLSRFSWLPLNINGVHTKANHYHISFFKNLYNIIKKNDGGYNEIYDVPKNPLSSDLTAWCNALQVPIQDNVYEIFEQDINDNRIKPFIEMITSNRDLDNYIEPKKSNKETKESKESREEDVDNSANTKFERLKEKIQELKLDRRYKNISEYLIESTIEDAKKLWTTNKVVKINNDKEMVKGRLNGWKLGVTMYAKNNEESLENLRKQEKDHKSRKNDKMVFHTFTTSEINPERKNQDENISNNQVETVDCKSIFQDKDMSLNCDNNDIGKIFNNLSNTGDEDAQINEFMKKASDREQAQTENSKNGLLRTFDIQDEDFTSAFETIRPSIVEIEMKRLHFYDKNPGSNPNEDERFTKVILPEFQKELKARKSS